MTELKFTKEEWETVLKDKGTPVVFKGEAKALAGILEALSHENEVVRSFDLSMKLLEVGVKVNYDYDAETRTLMEMVETGLSSFSVEDALSSIIPQ